MRCEVCGRPMVSWTEESWGRVERVYECRNVSCGMDDESEESE